MKEYQSKKTVHAKPMTSTEWKAYRTGLLKYSDATIDDDLDGYVVVYNQDKENEYWSWSPKAEFESGYLDVWPGNALGSVNGQLTLKQVAAAIKELRTDRPVHEDGELVGYWQTPEFIEYLLELADESDRVAESFSTFVGVDWAKGEGPAAQAALKNSGSGVAESPWTVTEVDSAEDIDIKGEEILCFDGCDWVIDYVEHDPDTGIDYMANGTEVEAYTTLPEKLQSKMDNK